VTYGLNPGGESLPSDGFTALIPLNVDNLAYVISWNQIPNADGYYVYRTPTTASTISQIALLTVVVGGANTQFIDYGNPTIGGRTPLPPNSLGNWHVIPQTMNISRHIHAGFAAPDPNNSSVWNLVAVGGSSVNPSTLASSLTSYEVLSIFITPATSYTSEVHTIIGSWTIGKFVLSKLRWAFALRAGFDKLSCVSGQNSEIWMTNGIDTQDVFYATWGSGDFVAAPISSGYKPASVLQGSCLFVDSNEAYVLSGSTSATFPGTVGVSALFSGGGGGGICPTLSGTWTTAGIAAAAVEYSVCIQEDAHFYILGGQSITGALSRDVQVVLS